MSDAKNLFKAPSDEVFLEIEGKTLRCSRRVLIKESDYFQAMFEGGFAERYKNVIKLEAVSFRAVEAILTLFWDERYVIHNSDLLLVLEATCMLQFLRIKNMCIDRIINAMNISNCFEIWRSCEFLDVKPLCVKAKQKALTEFSTIAQQDYIYQLDLQSFSRYIGNRSLECQNEMEVFQSCMRWFYENCEERKNKDEILFVLLGCLDFKALSVQDLQEMKAYPDILAYPTATDTINCVIGLKQNAILRYNDSVLSRARIYFESKNRILRHCACFVVALRTEKYLGKNEKFVVHFCELANTLCDLRSNGSGDAVNYKFKSTDCPPLKNTLYDPRKDEIRLLFEVESQKISQHLRGYRVISYKEFFFVLGGQQELGLREFVKNVWVYDMISEKWERSTLLPFVRRDFEVCISGHNLFIIGGSGEYASVQNNLFWYNCQSNLWSAKVDLPVRGDDLKVCAYKNQLFLLSVPCARAYLFNPKTKYFAKIELGSEVAVALMESFAMFNYREEIYFKGRHLLRTNLESQTLTVVETTLIPYIPSSHLHSVVSDDCLYTFYIQERVSRHEEERIQACTLEKFYIEAMHSTLIIDQHNLKIPLTREGESYFLREDPNLFLLQHYGLVEDDEFVTDYLFNAPHTVFDKE